MRFKTWKKQKLRAKIQQLKDSLRGRVLKILGLTPQDIINVLESRDFLTSNVFDTLVEEASDRVSISAVADHMSDDIQNWITLDYADIANEVCLSSLSDEIDWSGVIDYIDVSDIADNIDTDEVAMNIDNEALAVYVVEKIGNLLVSKANSIV